MSTPSAGLSAIVRVLTVPAALLVSALLVWQASNAAFSATTSNPDNSWTAGSVTLTDDDGGTSPTTGTAMFAATGLVPGSTGNHCIAVTSTGTVPATLKLYGSGISGSLAQYLTITVEEGTGGGFGACTGFSGTQVSTGLLSAFPTTYAAGVGTYALTGTPPEVRTFRFTYTLSTSTPDSAQGATAAATLVWEAQAGS